MQQQQHYAEVGDLAADVPRENNHRERTAKKLVARLLALGCRPAVEPRQLNYGAGIATAISAELLQREASLPDLRPVIECLERGEDATLTVTDLACCDEPALMFERVCTEVTAAGVGPNGKLGICLGDDMLPLRAFVLLSRCHFGDGPRYALMVNPERDAAWQYVWRRQRSRWAVWPAYGAAVTSQCPLLADEVAGAILPGSGLQAPPDSRWLPIRVELTRYADTHGQVRTEALALALDACVDCGEELIDLLDHASPASCRDQYLNRRIAVEVSGFGELIRMQGRRPCGLDALSSSMDLANEIRTRLWDRSRHLARHNELLPAIARSHPVSGEPRDDNERGWSARWQAAVERHAVRHRNLLVMSPYAVLPRDTRDCAAFADLLPVIGVADAHVFANPPCLRSWNALNFKNFHLRARAIIQRNSEASVIATRV